ncbi:MAG: alkaline phosphatase [Geminicoccaceae bacterium]|nr:alkaline phosphatase [Geminicoccaceae bacterium]
MLHRTNRLMAATGTMALLGACSGTGIDSVLPTGRTADGPVAAAQGDDEWFVQGRETLAQMLAQKDNTRRAKNVILFIGDGMGPTTVTAGRIFEGQQRGVDGESNVLAWETFPNVALAKTYNTNQQIADSAGTATAYTGGVKARAGTLGVDARSLRADCASQQGTDVDSYVELAEKAGMATGIVTTARLTHASPAATYATSSERGWEADSDLSEEAAAGGCKDIARQLLENEAGDGFEVAMGGGRRNFIPESMADVEDADKTGERADGRDLTAEWVEKYDNAVYVWNQEQFDAVDPATTDHLLGLFDRSHMEYEADRADDVAGEPSLSEMTAKAIDILSRDEDGFALFVEGGRIDHGHHDGNAYRALTDLVAMNEAVKTAMEKTDPEETLIIVTADHSHVFTIAGYATRGNPILGKSITNDDHGRPLSEAELAGDDKPYTTLGYGNGPGGLEGERPDLAEVDTTDPDYLQQATVPRSSETHGGEDVAVYARGPGAHLMRGVVEQSYVFHVMDHAADLNARAAATN